MTICSYLEITPEIIENFQKNLKIISVIWFGRQQVIADELGVTRQLINNMSAGRTIVTKRIVLATMYLISKKLDELPSLCELSALCLSGILHADLQMLSRIYEVVGRIGWGSGRRTEPLYTNPETMSYIVNGR